MNPSVITFTGIDPVCSRAQLTTLLNAEPRLEFGILYSREHAGKRGRYPKVDWIVNTAQWLWEMDRAPALHVCNSAVQVLLQNHRLDEFSTLASFGRLQLNGHIGLHEGPKLTWLLDETGLQVITQYDKNPQLAEEAARPAQHSYLFDASGGQGALRPTWPSPVPGVRCGYAGGLGPDNLAVQLPLIRQAAASSTYWIGMESSLRDSADRFSYSNAHAALAAIAESDAP